MNQFFNPTCKETEIVKNPTDFISETEWPKLYKDICSLNQIKAFSHLKTLFLTMSEDF